VVLLSVVFKIVDFLGDAGVDDILWISVVVYYRYDVIKLLL